MTVRVPGPSSQVVARVQDAKTKQQNAGPLALVRRSTTRRRDGRNRLRAIVVALSAGAHMGLLLALLTADRDAEINRARPVESMPITVSLIEMRPSPPILAPSADDDPSSQSASKSASPADAASALPDPTEARPTPPVVRRPVVRLPAPSRLSERVEQPDRVAAVTGVALPTPVTYVGLGDSDLVGATVAGSGQGNGAAGVGSGGSGAGAPCDMVRRIQDALRADPEVRAAVDQAHDALGRGQALLVWNGDWLQSPGQDGKGLAGVRQAIGLEIAFAPEACRSRAMRGLAVLSLADAPGSQRLVLGTTRWRWTDLTSR